MGIDPMLCDLLTTRPECDPFRVLVDHKRGSVLPAGPDLDIAKVFHPQDGGAAQKAALLFGIVLLIIGLTRDC